MAATVANRTLEPAGARQRASIRVTLTGVTSYTWDTGLYKVEDAGFEIVSGTGQGDCLKSTTVNGQVVYGGVTAMVAGDVLDLFAYGS